MLLPAHPIPPHADFWTEAARVFLDAAPRVSDAGATGAAARDFSGLRVVVPTFDHGQQFKAALARQRGGAFVPPRTSTLGAWLALQPPAASGTTARGIHDHRLMALYAELRQHAWLKKLFAARRNTDLLPLAQTLLALADELTAALLPAMNAAPDSAEARWQAALDQLPPQAQALLSEESQLVWSIWKAQLDPDDPGVSLYTRMMALATVAATPLVWITPVPPDPFAAAFLGAWGDRQPVLPILLDWRAAGLDPLLARAWPEMAEPADERAGSAPLSDLQDRPELPDLPNPSALTAAGRDALLGGVSIRAAVSLEDEAQSGAQTVIDWLQQGKRNIAIVAQDRVVARRIRALLQRAQVGVADETGWKLSTTRAAAVLVAWFDVITSRAETTVLLDFLKSPFLLTDADADRKSAQVMMIEIALRRANVAGGWHAIASVLSDGAAREQVQQLAARAARFGGRHPVAEWLARTNDALDAFGISAAFAVDAAGVQVAALLQAIGQMGALLHQEFSFAEWRAFVSLQLEATAFVPPVTDRRVVMLPLNGARLRTFDAVLLVGADAAHLPSTASETLFFANAVRRELGLTTRESRQVQQLRDFAELLTTNPLVVVSWQMQRDGEPNPVSNWIARLDLCLAREGLPAIASHHAALASVVLTAAPPAMPAPVAPALLPKKLSASGHASLMACPYQFFATRMLGLAALDELSDQPEKRDYGDWLHRILERYHAGVRDQAIAPEARRAFLEAVSEEVFAAELAHSGAALGYYDRWRKALPAYLDWANAREADGWEFIGGEQARERVLQWPGGDILLHGRIDRIDRDADGAIAVLDYKTSNVTALKKRLALKEEHQLAFYGLLSEAVTASAGYVSLDPQQERIVDVAAPDYPAWQQRLQQRIVADLQAIAAGAPLPAFGIESACQYCDMRGLCRKGAW